MSEIKRSDIKAGMQVKIVLKEDQRTGNLTEGIVKDILTKSPKHPHGIKVRLETGEIGRVKEILEWNNYNSFGNKNCPTSFLRTNSIFFVSSLIAKNLSFNTSASGAWK